MRVLNSADGLQTLQNEILEAVARGEALVTIMEALCRQVEMIAAGVTCSVVVLDDENRLQALAAPSLPGQYATSVSGTPIGPRVGSCGTAIHRGTPVEVIDIETDPLWRGYEALALPLGLRACWSSPIMARDGRVIGSFAFYYREKRGPSDFERQIVSTCVHLCAIAIEHEAVRARNYRLAYFDTLTGLPNRTHFNEAVASMARSPDLAFGLLLIDIDRLKAVNDTMGHPIGDALIGSVGARLAEVITQGLACRIGGDEFAVLLPGCRQSSHLRSHAFAILAAMQSPLEHDGHSITPSVTIGGALAGEDGTDSVTLRQNADFALYHAKETRRGGYVRFKRGLRTSITRRIQTIRSVDEALTDNRIIAHYQPIIQIGTNQIIGLEALARMRLHDGTILTAGEFQDGIRDPKVAYRITGQMLSAIAADMAAWQRAGIRISHMGLNVTSPDFQKGDLVQRAARAFDRVQLSLDQLVIEITEQVFMGSRKDGVARTIASLRERGVRVALDDFGTGFASLTHLLDFPVDIIKIDRAFIGEIESDAKSNVIVEALLAIAARLDMRIIAEGVETMGQAERLQAMGCRYAQGYLYSRAVPAEVITELLQRFTQRSPARPALRATAA